MSGRTAKKTRPQGFALIAVLWFLVLIASIGTYLLANARSETALAFNTRAAAIAEAVADAGVAQAVFRAADPVPSQRWLLNGEPHDVRFPDGEVTVRLYDETQKINPNLASETLMAALFEVVGVDRSRARRIGAAIADWVSPDEMPRRFGAKLEQYRSAGRTYGPPNAPLETLDELHLVLGMTPEIFMRVRPYLTIHTAVALPDGRNAPPAVRRALALLERRGGTAGAPAQREAVSSGLSGGGYDEDDDDYDDDEGGDGYRDDRAEDTDGGDHALPDENETVMEIESIARTAGGGVFVRHAVVRLQPGAPKGYAVLDWRRGELRE